MQALRVLHVTPYGAGAWAYGGIPRVSHALACGLGARGHAVTVCTTDACDADRRLPAPPGGGSRRAWPPRRDGRIELRVFPNVSNRLAYGLQGFLPVGLLTYLRAHAAAFDVAHLHACRNLPGVIAAHQLRRAGVPYVLAPNGTAPILERRRTVKRAFDALAGTRVLAGAARVVAVSRAEQRQLAALGVDPARIALVPNPISLEEFDPPPDRSRFRARHGLDGPVVAFLGQLTPRKRVDRLVRAFAALDAPAATLVVAGNEAGGGRAARAAASELEVAGRTIFTGLLEGRARLELLAGADVVVYPTEHEVFGLVPLEALLAGTPVVVTDDSGCGEVIAATGGGLVVPGDVEALRAAIAHVLEAPAHWRDAAALGARRARAWYATDVVCAQLEQVYRALVAAR